MYTYRPPRRDHSHIIIPIILILACATALVAANISGIIPPYVMQFIAIGCASVAIHFISRYSLTSFAYDVNDEKNILSVHKIMGKKSTLAAAIEYGDIIEIRKKEKGLSLKKEYNKAYKIYNFCANIFTPNAYYVVCSIDGQDVAVIIEADNTLLDIIKNIMKVEE